MGTPINILEQLDTNFYEPRDVFKMNWVNLGNRSLFESIALDQTLHALQELKIHSEHLLIGGNCVSYYVKPFVSSDIDILISVEKIPTQLSGFSEIGKTKWVHTSSGTILHFHTIEDLNLSDDLVNNLFSTANKSDGFNIASIEGIITLKLLSNKDYDYSHIESLCEYKTPNLNGWNTDTKKFERFEKIVPITPHSKID